MIIFPTSRDENWKYTDLSLLSKKPYQSAKKLPDETLTPLLKMLVAEKVVCENYLIYVNGLLVKMQLNSFIQKKDLKNIPKNDLNDIFEELNHKHHQERTCTPSQLVVSSNEGKVEYIQILYFAADPAWVHPSLNILLEENARAHIIETFLSDCGSITNAVTNMLLKSGAKLDYVKIQQEDPAAFHIGRTHIALEGNAYAKTVTVSLGSKLARSDLFIHLNQPGAECEMHGIYIGKNKMHLDHHTEVQHKAPDTTSNEFYKGILSEQSRAVFNGKVIVHPNAHKSVAVQTNHNLLLSSNAEIDTKPELEIYHDDVKCTHGAAIGQLDESALFYLCSRGIEESAAKKMLIQAFAAPIFDKIQHTVLREKLCLYLDIVSM